MVATETVFHILVPQGDFYVEHVEHFLTVVQAPSTSLRDDSSRAHVERSIQKKADALRRHLP